MGHPKITFPNGFRAMASLRRAADDPRIEEIEGAGMDEGRVFLHAARGYWFPNENAHSKSVGSAAELRAALAELAKWRTDDHCD